MKEKITNFIGYLFLGLFIGFLLGHYFYPKTIIKEVVSDKQTQSIDILGKSISITKPSTNKITKSNKYALDCKSVYYTNINIGGEIIEDSYIKIAEGHEDTILYVENGIVKFFGADYDVIQDDSNYLIAMRTYFLSGLTEVISINKDSGIGIDTKTLSFGFTGNPVSDSYIFSCSQI